MRKTLIAALALLTVVAGTVPMVRAQKPVKPPKTITPPKSVKLQLAPINKLNVPKVAKNLPKGNRTLKTISTQCATSFKPSGQRLLIPGLLAKMDGTEEQKAAMGEQLEAVFTAYETQARKLGMENDVAGALSFFLTTHYQVYKGGAKVSDAARTAIYRQFQSALDTDNIRNLSDTEKQQAYETLIVTSAVTLFQYKAAVESKDKDSVREVRTGAGQVMSDTVQAAPAKIAISEEGFAINRGAAADPGKRLGR